LFRCGSPKKKKFRVRTPTNPNVFVWTGQRKKAALLIAEGEKNYDEIVGDVGVHRETFYEWRKHPIFQSDVSIFYFRFFLSHILSDNDFNKNSSPKTGIFRK
jgi:hypothetical protein